VLEARHLVKRFFGITAVDDVSFVVRPGEVVGYLGPNGSGKTTTALMLTGLLDTTSGTVLFDGQRTDADPIAFRRRLGYVPEEPRDIPEAALERKITSLLGLFQLTEAAEQDIASYSKGMRQKVLLIAALLHDPDLLILDEPDSGLDVTTALVLRHLITILAARGKAVLYSSHVLETVEKLCSRVLVLHQGRVVADDSVERLRVAMASETLEEVVTHLMIRQDPEGTARDIADVVTTRA